MNEVRKFTPNDIKICLIGNKEDLSLKREVAAATGEVTIQRINHYRKRQMK